MRDKVQVFELFSILDQVKKLVAADRQSWIPFVIRRIGGDRYVKTN